MRRFLPILLLLTLSGCGASSSQQDYAGVAPAERPAPEAAATSAPAQDVAEVALVEPVAATSRKIVRNAELTLETDDPTAAYRRIAAIAEQAGGFVVTSESQQSGRSTTVDVTARVPADRFAATVDAMRAVGSRIVRDKITGQDVTEEYVDLEARIRTKQALEAQFVEILKQAKTVSDALEVQRQVSEVRGEIERLEGRRRYLENQSSLSTIEVRLQTPAPVVSSTSDGFVGSLKSAFGDAVDTGVAIVLGFIRVLGFAIPVALLILLPAYLLLKLAYRRFIAS